MRNIVPRLLVDLRQLLDDIERERGGKAEHFAAADRAIAGHLHRIMGKFAGQREIEAVFERLRVIGIEIEVDAMRVLATGDRQRAGRDLQQHFDFLFRRGGIGDDDVATVDRVDQELLGDEFVDLFAVFLAELVAAAEEVFADQDRRMLGHFGGRLDFFVVDDHRAAGRQRHLRAFELRLVLGRLERQIDERERDEHFGKVVCRLGEVRRIEWFFQGRIEGGVIEPERVGRDQRGGLLLERQVVIIAFDPLHRFVELAVVLLDAFGPFYLIEKHFAIHRLLCTLLAHHSPTGEIATDRGAGPGRLGHRLIGRFRRGRGGRGSRQSRGFRVRSRRLAQRFKREILFGCPLRLLDSQSIFRIKRTPLERRLEQMSESVGIGRQELELILHESRGDAMLAANPFAEQNPLPSVELLEIPRLEIVAQIIVQEPMVEKLLFLLVRQIGPDRRLEKLGIFLVEEEMQFVAGVFEIQRVLLFELQRRPGFNEVELDKLRVAVQSRVQRKHPRDAVVGLEMRAGDVGNHQRCLGLQNADQFLLRVVLLRIEPLGQPQIEILGLDIRKRHDPAHRVLRINGHEQQLLMRPRSARLNSTTPFLSGSTLATTTELDARKSRSAKSACCNMGCS